jgi:plastocyanin
MMRPLTILTGFVLICRLAGMQSSAQERSVTLTVSITRNSEDGAKPAATKPRDDSNVAVWLTPIGEAKSAALAAPATPAPQLVQRNKTFSPHILIVTVGTLVAFPNKDPFFHNIFSFHEGKRFDLGLYEAGTTRTVLFDRSGVSFLFCNIHAEMSAVIVAVNTPYYALSGRSGNVAIPNVPDGRYELNVWYERSLPEELKPLSRVVNISDSSRNLGVIRLKENPNFTLAHKNKYGLDYVPPPSPAYNHP